MNWLKSAIAIGVILAIVGIPLAVVFHILGDMSEGGKLAVGAAIFTLILVLTLIAALALFQRASTASVLMALRQDDADELAKFRASRMNVTHNYPHQQFGSLADPYGLPRLSRGMSQSGLRTPWAGEWADQEFPGQDDVDRVAPGSPRR